MTILRKQRGNFQHSTKIVSLFLEQIPLRKYEFHELHFTKPHSTESNPHSQLENRPSTTQKLKSQLEKPFPTSPNSEFQPKKPLSSTPKAKFQFEIAFSDNPKAIFHKIFVFSHWMKV